MAYKNNECNIFRIYLSDGAKKSLPTGCKNSRKEFVSHENICICTKFVRNMCGERVEGSLTVLNGDVKIPTERGFSAEPKLPTPQTGAP